MIRAETVSGLLLRLYAQDSDDPSAPYTAVCTVDFGFTGALMHALAMPMRWAPAPEIKGMSGSRFYPRYVGELGRFLSDFGLPVVKASRATGHVLPNAELRGNYWWWDTEAAAKQFEQRHP